MLEELIILVQIIFIDIILAADNAIIIGLIAANFVPKNRKKIILWGVAGALIFKVIFAIFATYLFQFYWIKIIGGLLLIGFGLSLLGESIIKKYENHPNWFYWGTLALVVFNSGICIVIKASSIKSKS